MARVSSKNHIDWYAKNQSHYAALAELVAASLRAQLKNAHIDFIDIPHRPKSLESFKEKIVRKRYQNPAAQMTDLAGVRVITYIESDVKRVAALVKSTFNVHAESSGDKSIELGADRFGYRSVHVVCDIGKARETLPEYLPYKGLNFEIQIRTALQHAWAEIEHDRSYKFSGELPSQIKRRFHLVAGLLETADREFDALTAEIDRYSEYVQKEADAGNLDIALNSTSILEFLKLRLSGHEIWRKIEAVSVSEEIVSELRSMDVTTLSDVENLLTSEFLEQENRFITHGNTFSLLRDAMMYADLERYFAKAWKGHWHGTETETLHLLGDKYGLAKVRQTLSSRKIDILDEDWEEEEERKED